MYKRDILTRGELSKGFFFRLSLGKEQLLSEDAEFQGIITINLHGLWVFGF